MIVSVVIMLENERGTKHKREKHFSLLFPKKLKAFCESYFSAHSSSRCVFTLTAEKTAKREVEMEDSEPDFLPLFLRIGPLDRFTITM